MKVYLVLYINIDDPTNTEIYGAYKDLHMAVKGLLTAASYREGVNDSVTQYRQPTTEYESYLSLYNSVFEELCLVDEDIYRIQCIEVQE